MLNYNTYIITNLNSEYFTPQVFSEDEKNIFSSIHLSVPIFKEAEHINSFYRQVTENCIKSILSSLKSIVSRETSNIEISKETKVTNKRKTKSNNKSSGICFLSEFDITQNDDQFLSLYIDYIIMTDKKPLSYHRQAQTWLLKEKRMVSLKESAIYLKTKIKSKNKISGFYLRDNTIYTFLNTYAPPEHRIRRSQYKNEFVLITAHTNNCKPQQIDSAS